MIKVGITGPMGSGKSYCSELFAKLGVPVFNSDKETKRIQNTNQNLKNELIGMFGDIYLPDGTMNSVLVRKLVFGDTDEQRNNLQIITKMVSPYVGVAFDDFCNLNSKSPYILAESAILFETGFNKRFDSVIYVESDNVSMLQAAIKRDGITEDEYKQRMRNQIPADIKKLGSKYIIQNDYTSNIVNQIEMLHLKILSKC